MGLQHNKKRNVGLLNEFFARYIARAIIEHKDIELKKAKELLTKHFQKNSDLYKELKIFRSLFETKLLSKEAACSLIEQAKQACKMQSQTKLDLEKTALLHEINTLINNPSFFNQEVPEYKEYGSVQVLMNHWRGSLMVENISEAAQLEDKLIHRLTNNLVLEEKKINALNMTNSDVDDLVVNIMTEKLNKKFNNILNQEQKNLLKFYMFSNENQESKNNLTVMLENIRKKAINNIEKSIVHNKEISSISNPKLLEIKEMLSGQFSNTSKHSDEMITFYLTVSKLDKELENHE